MEGSTRFEPPPGAIGISFVRGVDRFSTPPKFVKKAGLTSRFAVVQHTYVEGCADLYFDASLWRALASFVQSKGGKAEVWVTTPGRKPLTLTKFIEEWEEISADEREPPPVLRVLSGARPALCMVTTYWADVGGPGLYHDSYTYSLYGDKDLGDDVLAALAKAPDRARWTMAAQIHSVEGTTPPSWLQRLKAWVTGTTATA